MVDTDRSDNLVTAPLTKNPQVSVGTQEPRQRGQYITGIPGETWIGNAPRKWRHRDEATSPGLGMCDARAAELT